MPLNPTRKPTPAQIRATQETWCYSASCDPLMMRAPRLPGGCFLRRVSGTMMKGTSMTITLPLEPQEEAKLTALAQSRGLSADALVREVLDRILAAAPEPAEEQKPEGRPIWEVILDNMKDVPPEEFARLPKDGASEHDHYLYGHPKRNP